MSGKNLWEMIKATFSEFLEDQAMAMGAAVAFYTALSFAPLLILLLWFSSLLGGDMERKLIEQVQTLIGPQAGDAVQMVVDNAEQQSSAGTVAGIISFATLLFSASGVFAQLQTAMNRIWDVKPKPGSGAWNWIRSRMLAFGMVVTIGFLLLVSLGISAALSFVGSGEGLWQALNMLVSLLVFVLLFAMIFKFLPDVDITWSDVWIGAAVTAVLFAIGKFAIGKYLGVSSVGSAYGAAGSLVVLLVWVYYSSLILFFGAELTQQYARRYGSRLRPSGHAEWKSDAPEMKRE